MLMTKIVKYDINIALPLQKQQIIYDNVSTVHSNIKTISVCFIIIYLPKYFTVNL